VTDKRNITVKKVYELKGYNTGYLIFSIHIKNKVVFYMYAGCSLALLATGYIFCIFINIFISMLSSINLMLLSA